MLLLDSWSVNLQCWVIKPFLLGHFSALDVRWRLLCIVCVPSTNCHLNLNFKLSVCQFWLLGSLSVDLYSAWLQMFSCQSTSELHCFNAGRVHFINHRLPNSRAQQTTLVRWSIYATLAHVPGRPEVAEVETSTLWYGQLAALCTVVRLPIMTRRPVGNYQLCWVEAD